MAQKKWTIVYIMALWFPLNRTQVMSECTNIENSEELNRIVGKITDGAVRTNSTVHVDKGKFSSLILTDLFTSSDE
jgi:hypothetical protein